MTVLYTNKGIKEYVLLREGLDVSRKLLRLAEIHLLLQKRDQLINFQKVNIDKNSMQ